MHHNRSAMLPLIRLIAAVLLLTASSLAQPRCCPEGSFTKDDRRKACGHDRSANDSGVLRPLKRPQDDSPTSTNISVKFRTGRAFIEQAVVSNCRQEESMRSRFLVALLCCSFAFSQQPSPPQSLTIYNQNFAVVRQPLRLELKAGANNVRYTGVTAQLEPDSVVLRDPAGRRALQILEQNYQGDPVSMQSLMEKYQGQTIKFEVRHGDKI